MEYIADAREAGEIDRISIEEIGIPSMVLMERAALAVTECVKKHTDPRDRIVAVCGMGNNGGDGAAAARMLWEDGYCVTVALVGNREKASEQMNRQLSILERLGIGICTGLPDGEYNVILDALFGIGLSRDVTGEFAAAIHWMNRQKAVRFSVDVPSGINASTGATLSAAVLADYTITFGTNKTGLVLFPGCSCAGKVLVADIGFPHTAVKQAAPRCYTLTREEAVRKMPPRSVRSHKGSYGKVLVIAGSRQISGACYFTAAAAYRMGCGLVKVITAAESGPVIQNKLPEALVRTYDSRLDYDRPENRQPLSQCVQEEMQWATVIVIGPGIGMEEPAGLLLTEVLQENRKPVVIDADGLNLLAQRESFFEIREDGSRKFRLPANIILTPHLAEMSRLVKAELSVIRDTILEQAIRAVGQADGPTLVLKDARTIVTDGDRVYINTTGNNALATGGSGDVLSGMTAGLLAQGMQPYAAAVLAVCLHGAAAEEYMACGGRYSMIASDILDMLPRILPK